MLFAPFMFLNLLWLIGMLLDFTLCFAATALLSFFFYNGTNRRGTHLCFGGGVLPLLLE